MRVCIIKGKHTEVRKTGRRENDGTGLNLGYKYVCIYMRELYKIHLCLSNKKKYIYCMLIYKYSRVDVLH